MNNRMFKKHIYTGDDDLLVLQDIERVFDEELRIWMIDLNNYSMWVSEIEDICKDAGRMASYLSTVYDANFDHFYNFILSKLKGAVEKHRYKNTFTCEKTKHNNQNFQKQNI